MIDRGGTETDLPEGLPPRNSKVLFSEYRYFKVDPTIALAKLFISTYDKEEKLFNNISQTDLFSDTLRPQAPKADLNLSAYS